MNTYCSKRKKDIANIDPKMVEKKNKQIDYLCNQNVVFVKLKGQDL